MIVRPLTSSDDRRTFDCGDDLLNSYLSTQASQDQQRRCAKTHVAIAEEGGPVVGYYTLANTVVTKEEVTPSRRLPMYDRLPAILLARLGRDTRYRGSGIGDLLVAHAILTSLRVSDEHSGCRFVLVDSYPHRVGWYSELGFIAIPGSRAGANVKMFMDLMRLPGSLSPFLEQARALSELVREMLARKTRQSDPNRPPDR